MIPEIGLLDLAAGALIVVGIYAAFMIWLLLPILPFLVIGGLYVAARYGLPAFERLVVTAGRRALEASKNAAIPLALWILRPPAYARRASTRLTD